MSQLVEIRPGTDADVIPLCEFLNACTLVHQGVSRSSAADIVARLHREGADPQLDSFVAVADGAIVGFAHLWADGPDEVKLFARTHPDARGRGIGSRLLSLCDRRAAELLPRAQRTTTTWAADASAPALLEFQGYRPIRYFVTMEIGAGSVSEQATVWPAGIERVPLSTRPGLAGGVRRALGEAGRERSRVLDGAPRRQDRVRVPLRARALAARSCPWRGGRLLSVRAQCERCRVARPGRRDRRRAGAARGRARLRAPARWLPRIDGAPSHADRPRRRRREHDQRAPALPERRHDPATRVHDLGEAPAPHVLD